MGRVVLNLAWLAAGAGIVVGGLYLLGEGERQKEAVAAAVADARATMQAEQAAAIEAGVAAAVEAAVAEAVAQAVAETEARVLSEQPPLPDVNTDLDIDEETLALFPKGAYLMEVGDDWVQVTCGGHNRNPRVEWVRLQPGNRTLRSTVQRQQPSASDILVGILSAGLSIFAGPSQPVQTVFGGRTEGRYTTLSLGALRDSSEPELVLPQFRLTLYRIDASNFGVVERAPMDVPPAARPDNGQPRFVQILRRCAYQNGSSVDLT